MISIGFSTTKGLISTILRKITKSETSHAFIIYDWLGKKWVLESDWNGVVPITMAKFLAKGNIVVHTIDLPGIELEDLIPAMEEQGSGYDFTGLFGGIFPIIGHWLKLKWSNPFDNTKSFFCSELIVIWLQHIGYTKAATLIANRTTPQNLMDFLKG